MGLKWPDALVALASWLSIARAIYDPCRHVGIMLCSNYAGQNAFSSYEAFDLKVNGSLVDTIQPVNVSEWGQKPRTEFAVSSFNINFGNGSCTSPCNGLVIWSFANTLFQAGTPGPVITSSVVSTPSNYVLPADADQPTPAGKPPFAFDNSIATNDTRIRV